MWNLHRHVPQETITAKLVSALCVAITKKGGYPKVAAFFMPAGNAYSDSL